MSQTDSALVYRRIRNALRKLRNAHYMTREEWAAVIAVMNSSEMKLWSGE